MDVRASKDLFDRTEIDLSEVIPLELVGDISPLHDRQSASNVLRQHILCVCGQVISQSDDRLFSRLICTIM